MDIHHLRIFASVYRNLSFSKASQELYLSQPTISEHIKNLEEDIGCRLFDRVGRTIIATKEAEIIYPRAIHILEEIERIKEDLLPYEKEVKGPLLIGASTIPGTYILPLLASRFKRIHQNVYFQVLIEDSQKITDMIVDHQLTLGIVGAIISPERLKHVPFIQDELILAASPSIMQADSISAKELLRLPFVLREEGSGTRKSTEIHLKSKKIDINELNVTGILGSTDAVKQALKASLGVSILSRIAIDDELKSGSLKEISIRGMKMMRHFYLVTHEKRSLPNPYNAFYDFLLEEVR
ncbi:MAG: hypothetical protein BV458_11980 [Thermoplasmata archaeon M9B2D]|nr:MAG: hypothetical protein BV458_11980 [Thermoplasmata archaeon M9B2D]